MVCFFHFSKMNPTAFKAPSNSLICQIYDEKILARYTKTTYSKGDFNRQFLVNLGTLYMYFNCV